MLTKLSLWGNRMDQVQEDRFLELFDGFDDLKYLDISLTGYHQYSARTFPHFRSLRFLNMSMNSITFIPDGSFDNNPRLQVLDLSFNNITVTELTFSEGTRAHLEKLYLGGNPFVCNCHLEWFSGWLRSNNTTFEDLT
jgi:slit protein 2